MPSLFRIATYFICLLLPLIFFIPRSLFAVGESAVITLTFPHSAHSDAMGEVGTALVDDESVLFFNPAGLGMQNRDWKGGGGTFFYEPLLPVFGLRDLWHYGISLVYQPPNPEYGGFSIDYNYINMGVNTWSDDLGRELGQARSWESVFTFGWGFNFAEIGIKDHYLGVSAKYINSELAPGFGANGEGTARSIAFDAAYLWNYYPGANFGLTFANMGPNVFYISKDESDPIPFTLNLALSYKHDYVSDSTNFFTIATETRFEREIVKTYLNKPPDAFWEAIAHSGPINKDWFKNGTIHTGAEFKIMNTVSFLTGYLIDITGERYEYHWGIQAQFFNHYKACFYSIYAPAGYFRDNARKFFAVQTDGANGGRNGQWGISLSMDGLAHHNPDDLHWWKKSGNE